MASTFCQSTRAARSAMVGRGVVELHAERAGDEGVHRDVPALGEGAGWRGEAVGQVDVECHGRGIMAATSRGSKTSTLGARFRGAFY